MPQEFKPAEIKGWMSPEMKEAIGRVNSELARLYASGVEIEQREAGAQKLEQEKKAKGRKADTAPSNDNPARQNFVNSMETKNQSRGGHGRSRTRERD